MTPLVSIVWQNKGVLSPGLGDTSILDSLIFIILLFIFLLFYSIAVQPGTRISFGINEVLSYLKVVAMCHSPIFALHVCPVNSVCVSQ